MTIRWIIFFVFIRIMGPVLAQDPDFLVKEEKEEIYTDAADTSSLSYRFTKRYFYNADGLLDKLTVIRCQFSSEQGCHKENEKSYKYDEKGRISTMKEFTYNYGSEILNVIITRRYEYHEDPEFLESIHAEYDFQLKDRFVFETITYNSSGEFISWISQSRNDEGQTYTVENLVEYDNNGCRLSNEITGFGNVPGTIDYYYIREENTYIEDCIIKSERIYEYNPESQLTELKIVKQREFKKDSLGRIIKIMEFGNEEGKDTALSLHLETTIEYDELNRDTMKTEISADSLEGTRIKNLYDQAGNITYYSIEKWNAAKHFWYITYDNSWTYNDHGNYTSGDKRTNYDTLSLKFQYFEVFTIHYNENQQKIYGYFKVENFERDNTFVDEFEVFYEYGCDGRFLTENQIGISNTYRSLKTRSYFDIPPCEVSESQSLHLTILPNPSTNVVHIQTDRVIQDGVISIFNVNGKYIYGQKVGKGSFYSVDVSSLLPGIYFLLFETRKNDTLNKFVKI